MSDIELKGNIILSGFSNLERAEMSIIKKLVGSYAKKLYDNFSIEELKIILKIIHKIENTEKYEIRASVIKQGKVIFSEITNKNLFFATDTALKKIEAQLN